MEKEQIATRMVQIAKETETLNNRTVEIRQEIEDKTRDLQLESATKEIKIKALMHEYQALLKL